MNELRMGGVGKVLFPLVLVGLMAMAGLKAEETFDILTTKTRVYTNVTVTLKTDRHIHIQHAGGIGNVDLRDLDEETRSLLGYDSEQSSPGSSSVADIFQGDWVNSIRSPGSDEQVALPFDMPVTVTPGMVAAVFLVALLFHLFFSYCCKLICTKAGAPPGFIIWLPLFQVFPLFKAAGMSGWWFLGLFVPILNLVVQIIWCIKIVNARGKHVVWAILLVLPLLNIIAFLYLAFSGDGSSESPYGVPAYSPRSV